MGAIMSCQQNELEALNSSTTERQNRYSIFEKMEDTQKLEKHYQYHQEYKMGVYLDSNADDKNDKLRKISDWKKMAQKSKNGGSQKMSSHSSSTNDSDKKMDKVDRMLIGCKETSKEKFKQKALQGPPTALRWHIWKTTLKISKRVKAGFYEKYLQLCNEDNQDYIQIQKDLKRTFPSQYFFCHAEQGSSIGHEQLARVLMTISNYHPSLGYCQGMNFVIGFLILVSGGSEIEVFWVFLQLLQNHNFMLSGIFNKNMSLLGFIEYVTEYLMKKNVKNIYNKFMSIGVPPLSWMSKWFMTLFLYSFPLNICIRIWDFFIQEGVFGLAKVIIPILMVFDKDFGEMDELDFMEYFQNVTRSEQVVDLTSEYYLCMDKIVMEASKIKLKRSKIQELAVLYIKEKPEKNNEYIQIFTKYNDKNEFKKLAEQLSIKENPNYEETI